MLIHTLQGDVTGRSLKIGRLTKSSAVSQIVDPSGGVSPGISSIATAKTAYFRGSHNAAAVGVSAAKKGNHMAVAHLTVADLAMVARQGAGLTVSAARLSDSDLSTIARQLSGSAVLHIADSAGLTAAQMATVARQANAPAYVMFS